jgi:hypothetical protein
MNLENLLNVALSDAKKRKIGFVTDFLQSVSDSEKAKILFNLGSEYISSDANFAIEAFIASKKLGKDVDFSKYAGQLKSQVDSLLRKGRIETVEVLSKEMKKLGYPIKIDLDKVIDTALESQSIYIKLDLLSFAKKQGASFEKVKPIEGDLVKEVLNFIQKYGRDRDHIYSYLCLIGDVDSILGIEVPNEMIARTAKEMLRTCLPTDHNLQVSVDLLKMAVDSGYKLNAEEWQEEYYALVSRLPKYFHLWTRKFSEMGIKPDIAKLKELIASKTREKRLIIDGLDLSQRVEEEFNQKIDLTINPGAFVEATAAMSGDHYSLSSIMPLIKYALAKSLIKKEDYLKAGEKCLEAKNVEDAKKFYNIAQELGATIDPLIRKLL